MKKFEFVSAVAERAGVTKADAEKVIDAIAPVIVETCVDNGDEISLLGLGKFKQKVNSAHKGINPLTKKAIDIPESHTLAFKASPTIKKVIETKKKK